MISFAFFAFIGQALCGWLLADFIGGLLHWWEERIGKPTNRWIDKWVLEPNDLHHTDPMDFTKTPFWARNSTTFIAAGVISVIWLWLFGPSVVWFFATFGGMMMNEVHLWTHKRQGGWIEVFQKTGVIQSGRSHAVHHKPPQNRNFCILTDWLNPILEKLKFWQRLERALRIKPRKSSDQ